jgi:P2-related tail formation protein
MADNNNILATSVRNKEHIAVFDQITADRFASLPVEAVLVYLIDIVNANALPILGEQFDVMGFKGWLFTTTEEERRELIKRALELQRLAGTPWSVKEALRRIGYDGVVIKERLTDLVQVYDGSILHDGTYNYGGDYHWAIFDVEIPIELLGTLTAEDYDNIYAIVNIYKPVRSRMRVLTFNVEFVDEIEVNETMVIEVEAGFDYDLNFYLQ